MTELAIPALDSPPLERIGWPELAYGASPAAGAHFSQQVDSRYVIRLVSVHARLVTDANVANRTMVVEYRDAADNRFMLSGAAVSQTASGTNDWIFSAFQGQGEWTVDSSAILQLAPMLLLPTWSWRLYVANIQAGDQISRVRFVFEKFANEL